MTGTVLVINSGSSSLKYQLLPADADQPLAVGLIERIGESGSAVHRSDGRTEEFQGAIPDHARAVEIMQQLFERSGVTLGNVGLAAVGHRVVHGGDVFREPVLIDDTVLAGIRELAQLAPLHNPANATGIEAARAAFPQVPQVAVFDTAFFADLPAAAATYAIDREVAHRLKIRRYGFHGTSHGYVSRLAALTLGREYGEINQIVLHLGNGASASAIRGGRAVETSMGLTPLEGLVMGTRSGDLDPGALLYLLRTGGLDVDGLDRLLNRESGLRGLAGVSDFRDLVARRDAGDRDASLAIDVFCHRARKYIGAYLAVLGRIDALVFTAGVGENVPSVRAQIVAGLDELGMTLDDDRNAMRSPEPRVISSDASPVPVLVVPTNEELAIARGAAALVG